MNGGLNWRPTPDPSEKVAAEWPVLAVGSRTRGTSVTLLPTRRWRLARDRQLALPRTNSRGGFWCAIGRVAELKGDGFTGPAQRVFGCLAEDDESWQFGDRQHDARRLDRFYVDEVLFVMVRLPPFVRRLGAELLAKRPERTRDEPTMDAQRRPLPAFVTCARDASLNANVAPGRRSGRGSNESTGRVSVSTSEPAALESG